MSIRDLILFALILGSLPVCFLRPWIGVLIFSWIGYMNPHRFTWGAAYDFPFASIIAVVTLAGFLFTKEKDRFYLERETILIILLWIVFTLTSFSAFYPDYAWELWKKTSKIFLICLITIPLFIDKKKLRYLLLTIALSLGFLGIKGGIFSMVTAGAYNVRGPEASFIGGEGDFALALNMAIPLLFYLAREETNKRMKFLLTSAFALSIVSVIFTYRRGAFLGLIAVIFMLMIKSNKKMLSAAVLSSVLVVAPFFVTEKWTERMETIKTYEEDGSAMGRINAWKMAWNVAKDRPLKGAGFEGLTWGTKERYSPDPGATAGDVHSIYFEVLGEHGFIGFGLFIALLLLSIFSLRKIKKTFKSYPSSQWLCNYADMLQISIIAYMVGGIFLGRAYFDLFYHLVVIVVILKVLAKRELINQQNQLNYQNRPSQ
jgi:probable O-glycosylation ligase (exosortase A-associated)